jgi:hypothetical protein
VQLLINGAVARSLTPRTTNGFGPGQSPALTVGSISGVDLDDLRFYNRGLSATELCTTLVRGQLVGSSCVPLIPGFELDFEHNQIIDTGNWLLPFRTTGGFTFVPTGFGMGVAPSSSLELDYTSGFANHVSQAPGHSFSIWYTPVRNTDGGGELSIINFLSIGDSGFFGIEVAVSPDLVTLIVGAGTAAPSISLPSSSGFHNLLVTEKKVPGSTITQSLSIYLDGELTVMPIGTGNVYGAVPDFVGLGGTDGMVLDEIEFWPRDLSADPEMLCENGLDGEWDPVLGECLFPN